MSSPPATPPERPFVFSFGSEWNGALDATNLPSDSQPDEKSALPVFHFGNSSQPRAGQDSSPQGSNTSPPLFQFPRASPHESAIPLERSSPTIQPHGSPPLIPSPLQADPDMSAAVAPTTPPARLASSPDFHFGNGSTFSFRGLHNASPLPPSRNTESPLPFRASKYKVIPIVRASETPGLPPSAVASSNGTAPAPGSPSQQVDISRSSPEALSTPSVPPAPDIAPTPAPYDVRDEDAPQHVFFTDVFQSALQKGIQVVKKVTELLEGQSRLVKDATLDKLLGDANKPALFTAPIQELLQFWATPERSSLINSLLHIPEIAKTGDIGSACTSVVTEYRLKAAHHTAPITIEVEYLSKTGIKDVISEMLWTYRKFYTSLVQSNETKAKDFEQYERQSAEAWSALEAAFQHRSEFNEQFLQDQSEGAFEKLRGQLIEWACDIQWPTSDTDGVWRATANTAAECCEQTAIFMGDRYWPFTKIIRVYLGSQVLKTGVILADLPGLQDTNLARVRATQDYLMKCDTIFIVAKISRAITDQSVKSSLYASLSCHVPLEWEESVAKTLNIAVVCTKSEDINLSVARQEFCGPNKRIPTSVINKLDHDIKSAKDSGDRAQKKALKQSRELLFMEARNDYVKEGLRRAYASKVPEEQLDVFCVSNKLYEKQSRKGNRELVTASGIPEVRKFCLKVTADAQLREARHFLQSSLFNLLNSLEIWARSLSSRNEDKTLSEESNRQIQGIVAQTRASATAMISKLAIDFKTCFEDQIMKISDGFHPKWQAAAAQEERRWATTWHWTQYNAWCINDGSHATLKRPREDWNAEIIWKMRTDLGFSWNLVEEDIPTLFKDLGDSMVTLLMNARETITRSAPTKYKRMLADGISSRISSLQYRFCLAKENFEREVSLIRRHATESNTNSYVLQEMIPTYRDASNLWGAGKAHRQQAIVVGRINDGVLFPAICIMLSDQIHDVLRQTTLELTEAFEDIMGRTESDIDLALSSPSTDQVLSTRQELDVPKILQEIELLRMDVKIVGFLSA